MLSVKNCPKCGEKTWVNSTRTREDGVIIRKRICIGCAHEFKTLEVGEDAVNVTATLQELMVLRKRIDAICVELRKVDKEV